MPLPPKKKEEETVVAVVAPVEEPVGEKPPGDPKGNVEKLLAAARESGALAPIEAFVTDSGVDCTAEELLTYAQDIDETRGKSPAELVAMLEADPDLLDDIVFRKNKEKPRAYGKGSKSFDDVKKEMQAGGDYETGAEE